MNFRLTEGPGMKSTSRQGAACDFPRPGGLLCKESSPWAVQCARANSWAVFGLTGFPSARAALDRAREASPFFFIRVMLGRSPVNLASAHTGSPGYVATSDSRGSSSSFVRGKKRAVLLSSSVDDAVTMDDTGGHGLRRGSADWSWATTRPPLPSPLRSFLPFPLDFCLGIRTVAAPKPATCRPAGG